jgi:hypothetical protein
VDHHHDVALVQAEHCGNLRVEDLGRLLHFEVMVSAAERAHLVALAMLRALRHAAGLGVQHLAVLLDALEVLVSAPAAPDRPLGAAAQHGIGLVLAETNRARAAEASRDAMTERVGERPLHRQDVVARKAGMQAAHAAGDVESHAARRYDAALVGVERRHAADREAVAPVRVGHGIGSVYDSGQGRDVHRLLVDLMVHVADERFARIDHRRHAHRPVHGNLPFMVGAPPEKARVHGQACM